MQHRRDFLKTSSLIGMGGVIPTFLAKTALAAPSASTNGAKDTILVVIQLTGGNDGLNTVIPYADDNYHAYRPTIKIAKDRIRKINDTLGLHPSMEGMSGLL